jgi:hypothetical protein
MSTEDPDKKLAKTILDELDTDVDPETIAHAVQKDRDDRDALEKFYVSSGQKAASTAPPETTVAIWPETSSRAEVQFGTYGVSERGARNLGYTKLPAASRAATIAALRKRGIRSGGTYGGHEYVWLFDDDGGGVWSKSARLAHATRDALELASGRVPRDIVTAVVTVMSDDFIERSVVVELPDGTQRVVASERDTIAELDPTYTRNELLASDARWMSLLGRALAAWLGVPLRDEVFG